MPRRKDGLCPVCLVEHDEQIHEATVSIHQWLRSIVCFEETEFNPEALATGDYAA